MSYYSDEVNVEERERWADLRAWSIECVGALRQAFQPHVDDLT